MCVQPFKIRSVNPVAPKLVFVPCGHCKECRQSLKNSWSMRLALELSVAQKKGWHVGFCTLTYSDACLPRFPREALAEDAQFIPSVMPSCFDKKQVRDFIINLRRDLDSEFGAHGLKYIVCGEYGSHTQRPHYHCVFAWPPDVPDLSFFNLIVKYWSKFGFVFPKDFRGGTDKKGHFHKPFVVDGDSRFAGWYAGKYCCKDLDFVNSLKGIKFERKSVEFRNGDCFHIQNKSLGLSWLVGKSEDDLRKALFKGVSFAGDEKLHQLPLYLRNKIFFCPLYIVERRVFDNEGNCVNLIRDGSLLDRSDDSLIADGYRIEYKRLVRRKATEFFHKHYKEIFQRKVDFWSKTFESMTDVDTFPKLDFSLLDDRLTPEKVVKDLKALLSDVSFKDLASYYVARFGLPYKYQFDGPDDIFWTFRYTMRQIPDAFKSASLIPKVYSEYMDNLCSMFLGFLSLSFPVDSVTDKRVEKIKDAYKSEV